MQITRESVIEIVNFYKIEICTKRKIRCNDDGIVVLQDTKVESFGR